MLQIKIFISAISIIAVSFFLIAHDNTDLIADNFKQKNYEQFKNPFIKYGQKYNVAPELLWAIAKTESNFNPFSSNTCGVVVKK